MHDLARTFYYQDKYQEASNVSLTKKNAPYILGSFCFLGEHEKARTIYKEYKSFFGLKDLIFVRFHLGISYTRTSEYKKAKEQFLGNWQYRHSKKVGSTERFLIYQGLSFFRYFFSRHGSSLSFAKKAQEEFLHRKAAPAPLYEAFVLELIGHNYFQLGKPAKGEVFFKKALKVAKENQFIQLIEEFEASLKIYQSQFDINIDKHIKKLKTLLKKTSQANDYTSSELVLQIAKLYFLKGQYKNASEFILQHFSIIYKNDNKRKLAILNTLLAQLLLPKQQYMEALSLLKVAKEKLDKHIDVNLLAPILGVERKIFKILSLNHNDIDEQLRGLVVGTDKALVQQLDRRERGQGFNSLEEDRVGRLFDSASRGDYSILDEVIEYNFYSLIPKLFGPFEKKKLIILHPKNKGFFLADEEEVKFYSKRLSTSQIQFLVSLHNGVQSKESLIRAVWGYRDYDPIRHDHLVYTMLKRVRKALETRAFWIHSSGDDLFSLDSEVGLVLNKGNSLKVESKKYEVEIPEELNFRQVQILEDLFDGPFSAGDVATYFSITRMTSFRDLSHLVELGYLEKRGKGRGTKYYFK